MRIKKASVLSRRLKTRKRTMAALRRKHLKNRSGTDNKCHSTLRRELLDHVIVFSQKHLDTLLAEFIDEYYNTARPHQGIDGNTPIPQPKLASDSPGVIESRQVLNGLHCTYRRVAA